MKATGIVRKIDDLGRIVIPKEIRRTLHIRCGDSLEIFTENNGNIIFRKYSPVGDLIPLAERYAEVLQRSAGLSVLLCDRDKIIAAGTAGRQNYLQQPLSASLDRALQQRKLLVLEAGRGILPCEGAEREVRAIAPIITQSDLAGGVLLLEQEPHKVPSEEEVRLLRVTAAFLAKQLEE